MIVIKHYIYFKFQTLQFSKVSQKFRMVWNKQRSALAFQDTMVDVIHAAKLYYNYINKLIKSFN